MAFTNSGLVSYTRISPCRSVNRSSAIDTITIHCVVGQCSVETIGAIFANSSYSASANYGIGYDGRIGMYVEEKDRSWCSSNSANDNRAVTIEVASDTTAPYAVNAKAYASLLTLVTDVCKRNGIKKLLWRADKSLVGQVDKQNMTAHRWFIAKECPGEYLYSRFGAIAAEVNNRLGAGTEESESSSEFKVGDIVKITGGTYYNGKTVPSWVKAKNWVVYSVVGSRVILNKSEDGKNSIMSPFNSSALSLANQQASSSTPAEDEQTSTQPAEEKKDGCYASDVIAVAQGEVGYKEKASNSSLDSKTANSGSANYTKYARDFDQKYTNWYNGKKNGYAWCDMFVDWCFLTAFGYEKALSLLCQPEKSAGAGCTYSLGYYKAKGRFYTSNPMPGDQIFFGTSQSNSSHTGLVEKVSGGYVYTIEGNASNAVTRHTYSVGASNIVGYGRPNYDGIGTIQTSVGGSSYGTVRKGSTGSDVIALQQKLTGLGYSLGEVDGDFGDKTLAAVKAFQRDKSLEVDGVVGPLTWAALNSSSSTTSASSATSSSSATPASSSTSSSTFSPYRVKVTASYLNIRSGAGTSYGIVGSIRDCGVYTIVDSNSGWGKLSSGAGWIYLGYTKRV